MCDFCSDIKELQEYKNLHCWDRVNCIVYDANYNMYGYWVECEDSYYSGVELIINYCPKCGRKLND